jgi:hypothetical protein
MVAVEGGEKVAQSRAQAGLAGGCQGDLALVGAQPYEPELLDQRLLLEWREIAVFHERREVDPAGRLREEAAERDGHLLLCQCAKNGQTLGSAPTAAGRAHIEHHATAHGALG